MSFHFLISSHLETKNYLQTLFLKTKEYQVITTFI